MANNETKIVITAQTGQAEASLRNLGQSVGGMTRNFFALSGVIATLGGALSVTAFAGLIKSSIDAADRLNDLSKVTGLLPSQLAGIGFAAEQSGSDLEGVAKAVSKLAENMGKDADKFAKIGISAKDPIEAFKQLADVFNSIEDPQRRAAFASEALGKSWKEAAPLLSEGSKAIGEMETKGRALSGNQDELSKSADKFKDSLAELQKRISGTGNSLANELLPGLIATVEELNKLSASGSNFLPVGAAIRTIFETFVVMGANFVYMLKQAGNEIGGIGAQLMALARGDFKGFSNIGKMMKEDAERARKEIDAFSERILNPQKAQDTQSAAVRKTDTPGIEDFIGAQEEKKSKDRDTALRNWLWRVDEYHKEVQDKARAFAKDEEETNQQLQRSALEAQAIIFNIDPLAKASAEWERLIALKEQGLITDEQIGKSYAKTFGEISKSGNDAFASLESAVRGWGNQFTEELVKMAHTGKLNFSSMADSIISDLLRIQIQKNITGPMITAGTTFLDGMFGTPAANANGGVYSGSGISAYSGSVVNKPTLFPFAHGTGLMGEAGPEAILPLTRINGRLGVQAQGGSNAAPNVVINLVNQSGNNVNAKQQGGPQFDGRDWVIGVVLEAADSNPNFRNAMGIGAH